MERVRIRRLGYALGAELTGVDLKQRLDEETTAEIKRAWLDHIVLCFPGQDLDAEELMAFAGRFGELDENRTSPENRHPDYSLVKSLSNKPIRLNGKDHIERPGGHRQPGKWHSDQSMTIHPSEATFLIAKHLPDIGGNTMFANMYMAYETLSATMKEMLAQLEGVHTTRLSENFRFKTPEEQAASLRRAPPVAQPAVRTHPDTGRKALFIEARVQQFVGMSQGESKPLLNFLTAHSVAPEFVYRHQWALNDLLMWDNRCSMHIAVQNYDPSQLRQMLRCSIVGPESGYFYKEEAD